MHWSDGKYLNPAKNSLFFWVNRWKILMEFQTGPNQWTEKQALLYCSIGDVCFQKTQITSQPATLGEKSLFGDLKTWQQVGCYLLSSIVFSVSTVFQKAPFTRAVTGSYGVCSGQFLFLAQCLWTESWHIGISHDLQVFCAIPSGAGVSPSTAGTAMVMVNCSSKLKRMKTQTLCNLWKQNYGPIIRREGQ